MAGLVACNQVPSGKGNEGLNGGDLIAQQAATIVTEVVLLVESLPADFPEVPVDQLKAAVQRLRLIVRDKTFANGVETDASNNGFDLIELNGSRWGKISDRDRRLALVFHELLGLIGLEKNSYSISSRLLTPENRFQVENVYTCQETSRTETPCLLTIRFDRTQKALIVTTQPGSADCPGFESNLNFFYKHSRKDFSIEKPCIDPDLPPSSEPVACSRRSAPLNRYYSMTFLDGGRFFFSGGFHSGTGSSAVKRLMCSALP